MHEFLQAVGAQASTAGAHDPAALAALDATTVITALDHYAVISVQGPDSGKFLQGQTTCNVFDAGAGHSVAGAYCTPKGRMLASFQLAQRDTDTFWLRLRRDIAAGTLQSLGKYIVFSKAKLAPAEDVITLGLHGPAAAALISELSPEPPAGRYATAATAGGLIVQLDDAGQWFECWLPRAEAEALWYSAQGRAETAGSAYWQWLNIRAGRGEIEAATVDSFIPQMLNYHITGAVNFKKGCYTGQEIVARTQYRGQIKRHLYRAAIAAAAPAPGTDILGASGNKVGNVVNSVNTDTDRAELLAVIAEAELQTESPQLSANGVALALLELPYAIT